MVPYKDRNKQREAQQRSYARNRDRIAVRRRERRSTIIEGNRQLRAKKVAHVRALKEASPCVDCSVSYPFYVMDFDHVRGQKIGSISRMLNANLSLGTILEEIQKCDLVCANCHRERTHNATVPDGEMVAAPDC